MIVQKVTDQTRSNFYAAFTMIRSKLRSRYPERASALDFKDCATPRSGHNDVVFDLLVETGVLHLIVLLSNFSKLY